MANIKDLIQSIESGDSSFDEKLAAINAMEETLVAVRTKEQEAIDGGVAMIVDAVATMQRKVEAQIEVAKAIVPEKGDAGHDGKDGRDGKNGQDGRNGIDGQPGPAGADGEDGVSVVDAKIDFDGSLVIGLSSGREINVGEVVAADLAEKIKVTMSTNSTVAVQDEGTTITSGVRSLNFTGTGVTATASGDSVTVNVTGGGGGGSGTITISNKTADYLVDASDLGAIINFTSGPFTAYLTAAATLGSGFNVTIWNTSTGSITIDPDGTETIDGGQTTIILRRYEGTQLVCNGTGWDTGSKKKMQGYAENYPSSEILPSAFGLRSLAIGINSTATGARAISVGNGEIATTASGAKAFAFCGTAGAANSVAFGMNSASVGAVTGSTGAGAISLNGSYASGTDSFSAAVVNNTSTYGATGANTIVFGYLAKASATYALAIGGDTNESSGSYSVTIGGSTNLASGSFSYAAGYFAVSTQYGKKAYSSGRFSTNNGSAQLGTMVLRKPTTDATASVLTTDEGTAASTNQVILPNNSAFSFTGTIIARQQAAGGSNYAAWEIKGAIIRDANAASTTLGSFNINALSATAGASAWVVALTADTTNGGLAITVTGAAATNIRWVATVNTSEVTYA